MSVTVLSNKQGGTGSADANPAATLAALGGVATTDSRLSDARPISYAGVPSSSTAAGTAGQVAYDSAFFYECVAPNTWRRTPLATWTPPAVPIMDLRSADFTGTGGTWTDRITSKVYTATGAGVSKSGNYIAFDGASYLAGAASSGPNIGVGQSFTLTAWVNFPNKSSDYPIFSNGGDQNTPGSVNFPMQFGDGGTVACQYETLSSDFGDARNTDQLGSLSTGAYHHVAVTVDRTTGSPVFYIDGSVANTGYVNSPGPTTQGISTTQALHIGHNVGWAFFWPSGGLMGNIRNFASVLSAGQIAAEYALGPSYSL